MERRPAAGSIRNIERSKTKFLNAVGKILKTKGYTGLKINTIASTAGVDKKMIYKYFGGMDGLMDEYIRSRDYWSNVSAEQGQPIADDAGQTAAKELLHSQFDYLSTNKELQKLLLWRLSEERPSLRSMTEAQEQNGDMLFSAVADPHFGANSETFRAAMAVMISGIYYLNLYSEVNGNIFCGLDMKSAQGRKKVKETLSFMVDQCYEKL